jgi:prolyl oligopeptidase
MTINPPRSWLLPAALGLACATAPKPPPPPPEPPKAEAPAPEKPALKIATRAEAIVETLHGVEVRDPYRWLEDVKSPEVQAWMTAQNDAARAVLSQLPGRDALAARFRELYYVDSISAPVRRGKRFFYRRTHANKEKAIIYWKEGEAGEERVLLDPNGWSTDGTVSLGTWVPSWDGGKVAFAKRANNSDEATLHVLDVASGQVSEVDVIEGAKYASPSWTPDNKGFYYEYLPVDPSIPVDARPGYTEARFHALGTDPKKDPLVHPRTGDPSTFLGVQLSRDGRYLFVYVQRGWNENDISWKDLKNPKQKEFLPLVKGKDATYSIVDGLGKYFVVTDDGAPRKRIFKLDPAKPDRKAWVEVVPEDKGGGTLQDVALVGGRLALGYLRNAASELVLTGLDGKGAKVVPFPGLGSSHGAFGNPEDDDFYFGFSSFTQPGQVWKGSAKAVTSALWAEVKLPVDTSRFETEQVFYESKDGTKVPMFLVHAKGLEKSARVPTVLYGYGGFDVSLTPDFRSSVIPWLEAGGLYAVANLRGGGEFGKAWHDAGRGAKKQNVFDDFAAAAEWLAKSGWTNANQIGISGGSNGGLLVGAAMTQRPELYGAVSCAVPLLDMVRYHLFGSGRTWIPEYGSAENPEQFKTLHAYSPYHHVEAGKAYPPLLMLAADADDRVDPLHARKFVAAVQNSGSGAPALLRIEAHAGHGGADQVAKAIEQSADQWAFFFDRLGGTPPGVTASASPAASGPAPAPATAPSK